MNEEKYWSLTQDFRYWRKNLNMVFELMVGLSTEFVPISALLIWVKWDKVFKNGPSNTCGRSL